MKLYELINPSDPITFRASSHLVAIIAALILDGRGAYGADSVDGSEKGPILGLGGGEKWLRENGVWPLDTWIERHKPELAAALASFALGDASSRQDYDEAIAAITDDAKRLEFIKNRNDRRRTSMSDIEARAHQLAEALSE